MITLKSYGLEDQKKKWEKKVLKSCEADAGYVFAEGLTDSSCRNILLNCLKKLEEKVVTSFEIVNTTKESRIKGEMQLQELTNSLDHMKCGKKRKKKYELIKYLQELVSFLENKNGKIEQQNDWQERYSRRNCMKLLVN